MGERLVWARKKAGYVSARAAALDNGWVEVTYRSHETGGRAFDLDAATRYSRIFKVEPLWLLHGVGRAVSRKGVPIVGLAGAGPAGTVAFAENDGELGEAPLAPNATHRTVAVEVRGDSMHGTAEDGWLIYYDDRRDPPDESLLAQLCVVGLADGRVLVKWLRSGRSRGLFDLESNSAPPLRDAAVEWAARVTAIVPRPPPPRQRRR
ncbi:MAG: S24 family peptidase [Bauldia sp.]